MTAWIRVLCRGPGGEPTFRADRAAPAGEPLVLGREGDIGVGVCPVDPKVSRHAVLVTRTSAGWRIGPLNRNGVVIQPWGQPPGLAAGDTTVAWPRVALRVIGASELQHWVLLEDPALRIPRLAPAGDTHLTETADVPRPLTTAQEQAVRVLFDELLAWPPLLPAVPRQIKQVASRLGVRPESIQRRLEEVRRKATAVGLARAVPLTDPEYLYVLVRAGYLEPADGGTRGPAGGSV